MKVAFIHFWTLRLRRGVETLVLSLANELAKREGIDVSILTAKQTQQPLVAPLPQVHIEQFPTFRYYEFATIVPFYAASLVRRHYDIVIVFFADFGEGWALRLATSVASPRIFLYLTFPYESAPHRYHAYQRWGWGKKAERILADAQYTAQKGEEFFDRKVELVPSGTDPNRFKPNLEKRDALRRQLGFAENDVVLLNVSALEPRKGVGRVIEALPAIRTLVPNIKYLVLGEGAQKSSLLRRVAELGLTECVHFVGTTVDLPPFYNAADIFVMLPDAEAGSVACLEAMASELPVVVSNTGGFGEVVSRDNGYIVDIHDQDAIDNALVRLAREDERRKQMGKEGRQIVLNKFSWARIATQLMSKCQAIQ